MVLDDRRMKEREPAEVVVPRLLTPDHKRNHVTTSKKGLTMFSRNTNEFLRRFITADETWIHHTTPET